MATVSHRATGLDALRRRLATLPEAARAGAAAGLDGVAALAVAEARAMLQGAASPSEPGLPRADTSGRLAAGITASPTTPDGSSGVVSTSVTVSAPEAAVLKYGTTRMAARPFLRPAALRAGQGAKALLAAALRRRVAP